MNFAGLPANGAVLQASSLEASPIAVLRCLIGGKAASAPAPLSVMCCSQEVCLYGPQACGTEVAWKQAHVLICCGFFYDQIACRG
jgi:hypothetical protein